MDLLNPSKNFLTFIELNYFWLLKKKMITNCSRLPLKASHEILTISK